MGKSKLEKWSKVDSQFDWENRFSEQGDKVITLGSITSIERGKPTVKWIWSIYMDEVLDNESPIHLMKNVTKTDEGKTVSGSSLDKELARKSVDAIATLLGYELKN